MNPKRLKTYILMILTVAIWGIAGPLIKYALGVLSPDVFLAYRFAISAVFGAVYFLIFGKINLPKAPKLIVWTAVYGFLATTVQLGILFVGYDKTNAISAVLISSTGPLFASLAGQYFLKEHVTKREKIGLLVAFAGTALTIIEPALRNHDGIGKIEGNFLVFTAMLIGIVTSVIAKKLLRENLSPMSATNFSFMVGFITIIPLVLLNTGLPKTITQIANAPASTHLIVFYMALASGTLAYYWWHKAAKSIEIGEVSVFSYLQPVFATPLAILWLGEQITLPFIAGAAVIALGVGIAEYKKSRRS